MTTRGLFVVFEGLDRSGKTTQATKLAQILHALHIRFPDRSTSTGAAIDQYLKGDKTIPPQAAHLLFAANRWEWNDRIKTALKEGTDIVCDRYAFSGVAYSTGALGFDPTWCEYPDKGLVAPDVVIELASKKDLLETRGCDNELYEKQDVQMKVRVAFNELKGRLKQHWVTLDAQGTIEEVHERVLKVIEEAKRDITEDLRYLW